MEKSKDMNIIVLGAGLVGVPIALDLASDPDLNVTVADINEKNLKKVSKSGRVRTLQADLAQKEKLIGILRDFDLAVNATPGHMGYYVLNCMIEAGISGVDISFMPEKFWELNEEARKAGVTVIADMGVAPGLSNLMTGYMVERLDKTESVKIMVGGLPVERIRPFEYKAGFSPADVIEEYTRPAVLVENGKRVVKPALSAPEEVDFHGIGTLEAFNSDGLRSLIHSIDANNMVEKTLRYPGHRELMEVFRYAGFFSTEELDLGSGKVRPIDVTTHLLSSRWRLAEGEHDLTVMRIEIQGVKEGKKAIWNFDLHDVYDPATGIHSMGRTTGYSATMALRLILHKNYGVKGIVLPENIGKEEEYTQFILDGLKERGVRTVQSLDLE